MSEQRKFRVAMVAACPFPSLRGSQALVRELAESLASNGHDVHVVTYPSAQHMAPVERISIHRVPRIPLVASSPPAISWQKLVLDILLVWALWRVARQHDIDVIHAHNVEAPLVGFVVRALTGVPVVYHAHNALVDELPFYFRRSGARWLARRIGRALDDRIAANADHTIALSSRLGAYLSVRGASGKTSVIPPAVSPSAIRAPSARTSPASHSPGIVYAGNLDHYQNLDCLLQAFDRVCAAEPRAKLTFVVHDSGNGSHRRSARELASHPGISVRIAGTYAVMTRDIRRADVLVCPRVSWSGFPIKTLNYMAAGRPVVQARSSAHVAEHGVTGLLVEDDEPAALAKAILSIVRDPALADRLAGAASDLVKGKYVWPVVLPKVEAVYEKIVGDENFSKRRIRGTLTSRDDRVTAMPKNVTRHLAAPSLRRAAGALGLKPMLGSLIAAIVFLGCASQQPEAIAPLPPIVAPAVPGTIQKTANYLIEPGDQLRVKFLYHPELDVKVPVAPDGNMNIPGVGEVNVEGKTAEEVAAEVERISGDQLRDPEVTVIVAEFGERVVYVGGEVRLPGPVRFREGMTPLQAILDRGGFTEVARVDSVLQLIPNGSTYSARRLNYGEDVNEGDPELAALGVYDVIYVPRTFIGDANAFVRLYIRGLLPTMPRVGVGLSP